MRYLYIFVSTSKMRKIIGSFPLSDGQARIRKMNAMPYEPCQIVEYDLGDIGLTDQQRYWLDYEDYEETVYLLDERRDPFYLIEIYPFE